ncbi:MAG: hypothetical protein ACE5GH_05730, partial [Fidelibacterota bacterium]
EWWAVSQAPLPGRGRLLTQTEVALWLILAESVRSANRYQSRLRSFGAVHAGVDFSGKNDQFFVNVESYSSMELYNEAQLRARLPNKVYREEEGYGWTWDSDDNRRIYRRFRVHRDVLRKAGQFVMGGMVLNRIVSVIDVTYLHRLRELRPDVSIVLMGDGSTGGVRVILTRRF